MMKNLELLIGIFSGEGDLFRRKLLIQVVFSLFNVKSK